MMSVDKSVEWVAEETEVLGENVSQCHFAHHKSHMAWPWLELGPPRWEAGNYGTAYKDKNIRTIAISDKIITYHGDKNLDWGPFDCYTSTLVQLRSYLIEK
jgi:hypothetical protein